MELANLGRFVIAVSVCSEENITAHDRNKSLMLSIRLASAGQ